MVSTSTPSSPVSPAAVLPSSNRSSGPSMTAGTPPVRQTPKKTHKPTGGGSADFLRPSFCCSAGRKGQCSLPKHQKPPKRWLSSHERSFIPPFLFTFTANAPLWPLLRHAGNAGVVHRPVGERGHGVGLFLRTVVHVEPGLVVADDRVAGDGVDVAVDPVLIPEELVV